MKTRIPFVLGMTILAITNHLHAQGTAFTYQGQLNNGSNPATGSYDLRFALFDALTSGTQQGNLLTNSATAVSNGLFTVTLDFGNQFPGAARWLEIGVRSNGVANFTTLAPRQPLTPAPYAFYAESANATNLVGTVQSANLSGVALLAGGNAFTGQQTVTGGSVGIGTTTPAKELDVTGTASKVLVTDSVDPSIFLRVNNTASDGGPGFTSDVAGIGFGRDSTRQAIVGGTFGNDFLDFYTGGLLTSPKMRIDFNGGVTLSDPRVGAFGSGAIINLSDSFSGSVESSAIDSVGNGGGFTWRNGALELRPVSRVNIYKGSDVTSAGNVALTMIGSSGNVGIGTANPVDLLDVNGLVAIESNNTLEFGAGIPGKEASAGKIGYEVFTPDSLDIVGAGTNSSERKIKFWAEGGANFNGNVGIGTTTPQHKLDVNGNIFLGTQRNGQIFNEIGDTLYLGAEQKYLGNTLLSPAGGSTDWINLMANPISAGIMFGLAGPTTTDPHTNTTPLMVIKPSGNVGIGTTTPAKLLDVTGNTPGVAAGASIDPSVLTRLNNAATDGNTSSPDYAGIGFGHNSTRQAIVGGTFGNDYLDFYTGGLLTAPKMRIDISGAVTFSDPRTGTVGSGAQIALSDSFSGSAESSLIDSIGNGGGFTWRNGALELRPVSRVNIYKGFDVTSSSQVALTVIGSSGNVGIGTTSPDSLLTVNGTADKPGGGSWGTFSDARLKDVGADFTHGLEALDAIQPVHYHYKSDNPLKLPSQPDYVGVVAQQVESAIPEAVQRNQDGYLVVNNDPIIWTMFNAIKELNQQRENEAKAKDAQIADLQARLQKLEQRMTEKTGGAK